MYFLVSKNQKIYHEVIGTSKLFFSVTKPKRAPLNSKDSKQYFCVKSMILIKLIPHYRIKTISILLSD